MGNSPLIGCSISLTIESLQFLFIKGFSEVDDVMHNTVGCLIGWFMVKVKVNGARFIINIHNLVRKRAKRI